MKIGRNVLCPCGSGKKYKKCCIHKEQNTVIENNLKIKDLWNGEKDDDFDEQEFWFNAINGMHRYILEKLPHIKEYKKIRRLHDEIGNSMMKYYSNGKFEQKVNTDYVYQDKIENKKTDNKLLLLESHFDMEDAIGIKTFQDILIYKPAPNINCITEEFISKNHLRKPEKKELLQSMLDSKLGLFEVIKIDSHEGYVYIKEVFTSSEYRIIDIGLSNYVNYNNIYIYTRIITYNHVCFSTGLNFIFDKNDQFIKKFIERNKKEYTPIGEMARFVELYNRFSTDTNGIKVVTNTF